MRFQPTALEGVFIIDIERREDARGFFARSFCSEVFGEHGLSEIVSQCNISYNKAKGTLRGMHFQRSPLSEARLVRCTAGAIFDVVIDLRPVSATFKRWISVELSRENFRMVYVPTECAHGFQTLEDDTEVFYQMSAPYSAGHAAGVRWDDPSFGIEWPLAEPRIMSEKDRSWPDFRA